MEERLEYLREQLSAAIVDFELGLIGYEACGRLLEALDIRNSLSHVYKKEGFLALHSKFLTYKGFFQGVAATMGQE